jgi:hypothetical protein
VKRTTLKLDPQHFPFSFKNHRMNVQEPDSHLYPVEEYPQDEDHDLSYSQHYQPDIENEDFKNEFQEEVNEEEFQRLVSPVPSIAKHIYIDPPEENVVVTLPRTAPMDPVRQPSFRQVPVQPPIQQPAFQEQYEQHQPIYVHSRVPSPHSQPASPRSQPASLRSQPASPVIQETDIKPSVPLKPDLISKSQPQRACMYGCIPTNRRSRIICCSVVFLFLAIIGVLIGLFFPRYFLIQLGLR